MEDSLGIDDPGTIREWGPRRGGDTLVAGRALDGGWVETGGAGARVGEVILFGGSSSLGFA